MSKENPFDDCHILNELENATCHWDGVRTLKIADPESSCPKVLFMSTSLFNCHQQVSVWSGLVDKVILSELINLDTKPPQPGCFCHDSDARSLALARTYMDIHTVARYNQSLCVPGWWPCAEWGELGMHCRQYTYSLKPVLVGSWLPHRQEQVGNIPTLAISSSCRGLQRSNPSQM